MTDTEGKEEGVSLKLKTARTLKWNTIDRLASQVLYGVANDRRAYRHGGRVVDIPPWEMKKQISHRIYPDFFIQLGTFFAHAFKLVYGSFFRHNFLLTENRR